MSALLLSLLLAGPAAAETLVEPPAATTPARGQDARIVASLTLRVDDRAAALDAAVARARAAGGWFSSLSEEQVVLRVPVGQVDAVLADLRAQGQLVDRSYQVDDLTPRRVDLESRLAAREKVLARYLEVLATASPKSVVSVEREITGLVAQIEQVKGELRVLRDEADHARITVGFRYRERRAPVRDGSSSFAWLNSLNVADFLFDLEHGRRAAKSRVTAVAPDGFAAFGKDSRFQAVSPDDVAYRVRSAENDPEADLAFWSEAMRVRMEAAGYHLVEQLDVEAGGRKGVVLDLGAANGEQDQAYMVGLFVDGGWLVIVEATGQAERFAGRREAVLAAIRGISF